MDQKASGDVLILIARCLLLNKSERDLHKLDCAVHFDLRCMNGKMGQC